MQSLICDQPFVHHQKLALINVILPGKISHSSYVPDNDANYVITPRFKIHSIGHGVITSYKSKAIKLPTIQKAYANMDKRI
jgi:hypothetical protein